MRRRNDPFYGQDSGNALSEEAQEEIGGGKRGKFFSVLPGEDDTREQLAKGNNVDFSQRTAASEADEYTEQAERITRSLERSDAFKYSGQFSDPEKRREFVEQLADELAGRKSAPKPQPQEEKEKPFLSRKADDEFWASDEPKKQMPKRL